MKHKQDQARPHQSLALRQAKLRPLDVVLLSDDTKQSQVLSKLSAGFSHVALALHDMLWFDATEYGVGYDVRPMLLSAEGEILIDSGVSRSLAVLRHPALGSLSSARCKKLLELAEEECNRLNGLNYAASRELLTLLNRRGQSQTLRVVSRLLISTPLPETLDWLLALHVASETAEPSGLAQDELALTGARPTPGLFCSSLVVGVFERLGLDFVTVAQSTRDYLPRDFGDNEMSLLQEVQDIVIVDPPLMDDAAKDREPTELELSVQECLADSHKAMAETVDMIRQMPDATRLDRVFNEIVLGKERALDVLLVRLGQDSLLSELHRRVNLLQNVTDLALTSKRGVDASVERWLNLLLRNLELSSPFSPGSTKAILTARQLTRDMPKVTAAIAKTIALAEMLNRETVKRISSIRTATS